MADGVERDRRLLKTLYVLRGSRWILRELLRLERKPLKPRAAKARPRKDG